MKIYVNGEERTVSDGLMLTALLHELSVPDERIAVELNRSVVRKRDWETTSVADGDKVEIVHFVGGG